MKNPLAPLRLIRITWPAALALLLAACATTSFHAAPAPTLQTNADWVVAPLLNNTATPYAGERAQRILGALLSQHAGGQVSMPPATRDTNGLPVDNGQSAEKAARDYAGKHDARYLVTGSVEEWHYKIGLDGQPAVGFTLKVEDLSTDRTVWTGVASASGGSREGIAVLAQKTLARMSRRLLGH